MEGVYLKNETSFNNVVDAPIRHNKKRSHKEVDTSDDEHLDDNRKNILKGGTTENEATFDNVVDAPRRNNKKRSNIEGPKECDGNTGEQKSNVRNGIFIKTKRQLDMSRVKDLKKCKRKFKLDVEKHLKIGLEVGVGKLRIGNNTYVYNHHAIVIQISKINKTFEMVALTAKGIVPALRGKDLEPMIETTSNTFATKDLFYYDYNHLSDKDVKIKNRAEALVSLFVKSGVKYNLREFNCEHFASYCSTGLAFSGQINNVNWEATDKLDKLLKEC